MPLDKAGLKSAIRNMIDTLSQETEDSETSVDRLADAIETYVKSGTVTVTAQTGQIQVQGSATAQQNIAPISITGSIS